MYENNIALQEQSKFPEGYEKSEAKEICQREIKLLLVIVRNIWMLKLK